MICWPGWPERGNGVSKRTGAPEAYFFIFAARLYGPVWREERVAVAVEARRGGFRVVEVGPPAAFAGSWWGRVEAEAAAQTLVAVEDAPPKRDDGEGEGRPEEPANAAYALAEKAARARLATVAAEWAEAVAARRAEEERWLLEYYQRRLSEEMRSLKRALHQVAVLQVRIRLAQHAVTLQQFQGELAGWERTLGTQLVAKQEKAASLAWELGRRYRELERRYQAEAAVTLLAAARLPAIRS